MTLLLSGEHFGCEDMSAMWQRLRQWLSTSFKRVVIYHQMVGFTGPLMTYMWHPRDPLVISDLWPPPSESCHWIQKPWPQLPGHSSIHYWGSGNDLLILSMLQHFHFVMKKTFTSITVHLKKTKKLWWRSRRSYLTQWGTSEQKLCNILQY